ncbi:MAG TPA: hypothetical protein VNF71_16140 [Acidimicrobiales bacterium]|nr:hypothetical protein [Acidimicrobiales bacterium]
MQNHSTPSVEFTVDEASDDPLAEIDHLMQKRVDEERRSTARSAELLADRVEFSAQFSALCDQQVRPRMEEIIERLRRNGGDGAIEELPEDESLRRGHRLILWMSLDGEIIGTPRQDRHPYLQLDADVDKRSVSVSEGDMWQGHGGNRSGRVGEWRISEITPALVTKEALAVLRRSVRAPST